MSILNLSKEESSEFGLKIARSNNIKQFDYHKISEEVYDQQYDLLRVKISMSNPSVFNDINKIGIPYNFFSFLIRKSTFTTGTIEYRIPELTIVKYNSSMKNDLSKVLESVIKNSSGVNFSNSIYNFLIDKEKMTKSSIAYYVNLAEHDKHCHFYIGYMNNICVGFCSFKLENNIAEGVYFGVTLEYRNLGLAHEFLTHAKHKCFELGAHEFYTDTIIQNPNSLYPQMNIGLIPKETFLNVVFFPLLSKKPEYKKNIILKDYFDIFFNVQKLMKEFEFEYYTIEEVKSIPLSKEIQFPSSACFGLHVISKKKIIISVVINQHINWTYFICNIH
jgi:hypothetical protein